MCSAASAFAACSGADTLGPPQHGTTSAGQGGSGGDFIPPDDGGPPPLDASGLCGNQLHDIITDAPNVYFVIDASGSMAEPVDGSTRYKIVRKACIQLVRDLGALINVGAALFPVGATDDEPCVPGEEVMEVLPGDPASGDVDGPTTNKFKNRINVEPFGGTPVSATLALLHPSLKALPGKTIVLLVTDGGPNCNPAASCDASGCQPNIEGCTGATCCDPGGNCCEPDEPGGPSSCVDRQATLDVLDDYAASELPVYVIGIPGSEVYSGVLEEMAIAAGTAQLGKPFYYRVDTIGNLGDVLGGIAAVAISCVFTVQDPPAEPDQTNVYTDGVVLPADPVDGWRWVDAELTQIELLGEACTSLKTGKIGTVQIVSGCPTEPPK